MGHDLTALQGFADEVHDLHAHGAACCELDVQAERYGAMDDLDEARAYLQLAALAAKRAARRRSEHLDSLD